MTDSAEQRQHTRFDLPASQQDVASLPGWIFKPVQFTRGPAGLVLNISNGGLQVLTSASETLDHGPYEVVLLLGQGVTRAAANAKLLNLASNAGAFALFARACGEIANAECRHGLLLL